MFNSLQEKLETAFKNLKGQGRVTELNIASTIKDIRRALVDADVNYKIAKEFTDKVKDKAIGEKVINALSPGQLMVKIVKDELAELMGGEESSFNAKGNPAVILIAGLQGSGKTTFSGKLANYLKTKKGFIADVGGRRCLPAGSYGTIKNFGRTDWSGCSCRIRK
jgi:signal recognition particle subunit SRP54